MPKHQPTAAKKARAAAREGAKYTAALRGQRADGTGEAAGQGTEIAAQDWRRHAIVQYVAPVSTSGPYTDPVDHAVGDVTRLWQHGSVGEPVDRSTWHTNWDADLMAFVDGAGVRVVEVLLDVPPVGAGPSRAELIIRRWQRAHAWATEVLEAIQAGEPIAEGDVEALLSDRAQATRDLRDVLPRRPVPGRPSDPVDAAEVRRLLAVCVQAMEEIALPDTREGSRLYQRARAHIEHTRTVLARTPDDPGEDTSALVEAAERLWNHEGLDIAVVADQGRANDLAAQLAGRRHPPKRRHTPARALLAERIAAHWAQPDIGGSRGPV